jgi:hypothetical protein
MDFHGLSWTIMDYHGLSWTIMDLVQYYFDLEKHHFTIKDNYYLSTKMINE